jgi:hypothetical protein
MNGKLPSSVIRLVADSEIHFELRDGRLHHEGKRIGIPDIDPELVVRSRGSIGIDETLDLHLELPRLRKRNRDQGPLQAHVTGTLREPKIAIQDAPLIVRSGMARWIMRAYVWACRSRPLSFSLRCTARCASIVRSTSLWQFLEFSVSKVSRIELPSVAGRFTILRPVAGSAFARAWTRLTLCSYNLCAPVRSLRLGSLQTGYQQRVRAVAAGLMERVRSLKQRLRRSQT